MARSATDPGAVETLPPIDGFASARYQLPSMAALSRVRNIGNFLKRHQPPTRHAEKGCGCFSACFF